MSALAEGELPSIYRDFSMVRLDSRTVHSKALAVRSLVASFRIVDDDSIIFARISYLLASKSIAKYYST